MSSVREAPRCLRAADGASSFVWFRPDMVILVLPRTRFSEARSCPVCHVLCDCTQPRPPSALASVASECRTSPRFTCWEDMCSLKRWTRPSKKKPYHALCKGGLCLLAASLLVCGVAWTELSTNEAAYHVCPERKPPPPIPPFPPPTWPASPQDLSCRLSIPSLGLSSLKAMFLTPINSSCFQLSFLSVSPMSLC